MVNEYESHLPELQQIILVGYELQRYQAKELICLTETAGRIDMMPYELMLKILDHNEVCRDDKMEVVFLVGMRAITYLLIFIIMNK